MAARRDRRVGVSAPHHQAARATGKARRRRLPAGRHRWRLLAAQAGAELRCRHRLSGRGRRRGYRRCWCDRRSETGHRRARRNVGRPSQCRVDGRAEGARAAIRERGVISRRCSIPCLATATSLPSSTDTRRPCLGWAPLRGTGRSPTASSILDKPERSAIYTAISASTGSR